MIVRVAEAEVVVSAEAVATIVVVGVATEVVVVAVVAVVAEATEVAAVVVVIVVEVITIGTVIAFKFHTFSLHHKGQEIKLFILIVQSICNTVKQAIFFLAFLYMSIPQHLKTGSAN
jgi:hypothetical protein